MKKPLWQGKKKDGAVPVRVLAATENRHKVREIGSLLGGGFRVYTLREAGLRPRFRETGRTFEANARLKLAGARRALEASGNPRRIRWVLADDSGLCVDALGGRPGVRSARFAGHRAGDRENRERLLRLMRNKKRRQARFVCVVALGSACRGGRVRMFRGVVEGRISPVEQGDHGFGYDPVFIPRGLTRTFGRLAARTKNRMSHRAASLKKMRRWLGSLRQKNSGR